MKSKILSLLDTSQQIVSGENISRELNISRVAVWKHIRQMQAAGFQIESTSKGYRLLTKPDTVFPWQFGARIGRIHYFEELTSTMEKAMELARGGCPEFTVVVADRQTHGRGRLSRSWQSEDGGLFFTIVLRPKLTPAAAALLNFAVGVDLVSVIEDCCGIRGGLKWPNDLLVQGRKMAGILSQMVCETDVIEFVNIGIGINVNNRPQTVEPPAVSISELTGACTPRARLLSRFLDRFEQRMKYPDLSTVVAEWKKKTVTVGKQVKVQTTREVLEGRAVDIDPQGGLVLETAGGERRTIVYGDCFHQER